MLTSKDRAYLRSLANGIETILTVGHGGITDNTIADAEGALRARELIKGQVLETAPETAREAAATLAEATDAEVVQVIGRRFVLYKRNLKDPKIVIGASR